MEVCWNVANFLYILSKLNQGMWLNLQEKCHKILELEARWNVGTCYIYLGQRSAWEPRNGPRIRDTGTHISWGPNWSFDHKALIYIRYDPRHRTWKYDFEKNSWDSLGHYPHCSPYASHANWTTSNWIMVSNEGSHCICICNSLVLMVLHELLHMRYSDVCRILEFSSCLYDKNLCTLSHGSH